MKRIIFLIYLLLLCQDVHAQLWSGYLNNNRGIDWAGIPYAIPSANWPQCGGSGGTIVSGTSITSINSTISTCPDNTYLLLGVGTFDVGSNFIAIRRSNFELRGAGPMLTIVQGTGGASVGPGSGLINIDQGANFFGSGFVSPNCMPNAACVTPPATNGGMLGKVITSGATPGSTAVVLTDVNGLSQGQTVAIWMDNEDNSSSLAPMVMCGAPFNGFVCLHWSQSDVSSGLMQLVQIGTVNAGTNTITFSSPLYYSRWANNRTPILAYIPTAFVTNVGVSNLTIFQNTAPVGNEGGLNFYTVNGGWATNIRFNQCRTTCMQVQASRKVVAFNNYLFQSNFSNTPSSRYGINYAQSTDIAFYNNICQQIQACILGNGGSGGVIIAYNYAINDEYFDSGNGENWLNAGVFANHADGNHYNLLEGNDLHQHNIDWAHGTGAYNVMLRNFFAGQGWSRSTLTTNDTVVTYDTAYTRFTSYIGNVLGTPGLHNTYETQPSSPAADPGHAVYHIGFCALNNATGCGTLNQADTLTYTSMFRWFNYDTVNAGTRCVAGEVPSDITQPSGCTAPTSFWLASKPAWFGANSWPAIGPDVVGGTAKDPGGHTRTNVSRIPARVCYEDIMLGPADGQGTVLSFDPVACYSQASPSKFKKSQGKHKVTGRARAN